jgi:hypothetical protein
MGGWEGEKREEEEKRYICISWLWMIFINANCHFDL